MAVEKVTQQQIGDFLQHYGDWSLRQDKLHREYVFSDFVQAFGFMAQAALVAEKANHHPEWCNVYKRVSVDLTTHEAGGITQRDFDLAASMEALAMQLTAA